MKKFSPAWGKSFSILGTDPTIANKIKGLTGPVPVVSLYTFYMFCMAITPLQLPPQQKPAAFLPRALFILCHCTVTALLIDRLCEQLRPTNGNT
jgi:hypothetical protein